MSLNQSIFQALRLEKVGDVHHHRPDRHGCGTEHRGDADHDGAGEDPGYRDSACRWAPPGENIRRIFILQGVIIGVIGTDLWRDSRAGHLPVVADKYHLISLAPDVYTIAYVPFTAGAAGHFVIVAALRRF